MSADDTAQSPLTSDSVLRASGLRKLYGAGEGLVRAVDGIDLDVARGEAVAVMGPSGCGSRRCCTCSAGSIDRPAARCRSPAVASTSSANETWRTCVGPTSASCSRRST
jgi:ABC-type dipeptide/oligopeptide/nickel transport system ATPase component